MRGLALLAAVVALVLLAACGDDAEVQPSVAASQTPTPTPAYTAPKPTGSLETLSVTPSPPPFIDHSVQPCTSDDLIAVFGHVNGMTMGQLITYIDFANVSATVCRLEGRPGIEMLDGVRAAAALTRSDFCFGAPCVVQSAILSPNITQIKTREPDPGTASIALYWPTYLVEGPPCQPPALKVTVVRVSLPEGGGTIDVPVKDQALEVTNKTDQAIGVQLADVYESLTPGATSTMFAALFGSYLVLGVHLVHVSYYHGSGPEIWLVTPAETPGG